MRILKLGTLLTIVIAAARGQQWVTPSKAPQYPPVLPPRFDTSSGIDWGSLARANTIQQTLFRFEDFKTYYDQIQSYRLLMAKIYYEYPIPYEIAADYHASPRKQFENNIAIVEEAIAQVRNHQTVINTLLQRGENIAKRWKPGISWDEQYFLSQDAQALAAMFKDLLWDTSNSAQVISAAESLEKVVGAKRTVEMGACAGIATAFSLAGMWALFNRCKKPSRPAANEEAQEAPPRRRQRICARRA